MKQFLANKLLIFVQKDKTLAHAYKYQDKIFWLYNIVQFLQSGNCPNMNIIKSCWPQIRQITIKKDAS